MATYWAELETWSSGFRVWLIIKRLWAPAKPNVIIKLIIIFTRICCKIIVVDGWKDQTYVSKHIGQCHKPDHSGVCLFFFLLGRFIRSYEFRSTLLVIIKIVSARNCQFAPYNCNSFRMEVILFFKSAFPDLFQCAYFWSLKQKY